MAPEVGQLDDDLVIDEQSVYDTREVWVKVENAPPVWTTTGRTPIDPYSVHLTFNIPRSEVRTIHVLGRTFDEKPRRIRRHVEYRHAEGWLCDLVERYRP